MLLEVIIQVKVIELDVLFVILNILGFLGIFVDNCEMCYMW